MDQAISAKILCRSTSREFATGLGRRLTQSETDQICVGSHGSHCGWVPAFVNVEVEHSMVMMAMSNQLVVFALDEQRYGLSLSSVERAARMVEITRLPKAPDIVLGVINVQ